LPTAMTEGDESRGKKDRLENLLFITILAVFILLFFFLHSLLNTSVPLAVVSSWSMEPTLHVGDLVIVQGQSHYKPGDIVVYTTGKALVVHRIVKQLEDGTFLTKGDANVFADAIHPSLAQIKGKVILVIPYFGTLKLIIEKILFHHV